MYTTAPTLQVAANNSGCGFLQYKTSLRFSRCRRRDMGMIVVGVLVCCCISATAAAPACGISLPPSQSKYNR